jgi:hypothetical protein
MVTAAGMAVSRWSIAALFYSAWLVVLCAFQWAERASLSADILLGIVVLNATMAFGLAALLEIAQWLRARSAVTRNWCNAACVVAGGAFSWAVGLELVGGVSFMQGVGYQHALAAVLATGLLVVLNTLRANAFGGKLLNLALSLLFLFGFTWLQHRYRMQMREARYAGVSAAFLLLTGLLALRIVERWIAMRPNPRTFASVLLPLGLFASLSNFVSESATKRLYFAGLFPGRFVFAMHLPELVTRSKRLDPAVAHAAWMPKSVNASLEPLVEPNSKSSTREAGVELVVIMLMDAVRQDAFQHYVERTDARLHRAWKESCLSTVGYSPASDTVMTLDRMLLRPGTKAELWLESVRRAGVSTSVVLDSSIMNALDQRLSSGFSSHFGTAVRLRRTDEHPPQFESVSAAARKLIAGRRERQLVWAHFLEAHEWFTGTKSQSDREAYDEQVAHIGDEIAGLVDDIRASQRPATVVVLADHGEGVDHFATRTHGVFLYEPLVRVPLMVWTNGRPCSPTLRGLAAMPATNILVMGRMVLDELSIYSDPNLPTVAQIAAAPIILQSGIQDAVVRWPYKLIVSPWFSELFDLHSDPLEQHNLVKKDPGLAAKLGRMLHPAL